MKLSENFVWIIPMRLSNKFLVLMYLKDLRSTLSKMSPVWIIPSFFHPNPVPSKKTKWIRLQEAANVAIQSPALKEEELAQIAGGIERKRF